MTVILGYKTCLCARECVFVYHVHVRVRPACFVLYDVLGKGSVGQFAQL